jgi:uncharacterized protein
MRDRIIAELQNIEKRENVRVLYAVESGSRAWGFPSQDSDYDIRFLYVRPLSFYLSIVTGRDVIEQPIDARLDISGWDLRKALQLFQRSNPSVLEWLHSSMIYRERFDTGARLRALEPLYVTLRSSMYHYISLAEGQFNRYMQGERVPVKKYFYVLRPVLACGWLMAQGTFPPLAFLTLMRSELPGAGALTDAVQSLLQRKLAGDELDMEPQIPVIHAFINDRIAVYKQFVEGLPREVNARDHMALDDLFRALIQEAWGA